MPYARPPIATLVQRSIGDLDSRVPGADASIPRRFMAALATAHAAGLHGLYGDLDFLARQLFPETAEGEFLLRHGSRYGITPKDPTAANGLIGLTGTNGDTVAAGTILNRRDLVQFATLAAATIAGGVATVSVQALLTGIGGNTAPGASLTFVNPVAGISSNAVVGMDGLAGGNDVEGQESLRARILQRRRQPPHGGDLSDYEEWALAQPGVTRAWIYPQWAGPGTVGITFVMDGRPNIIPLIGDVTAVTAALTILKPVTAQLVVFAPTPVNKTLTIHLNGADTPSIRAAVDANCADLFARESIPGGTLYKSHIDQAIATAAGEIDHLLSVPAADIVMPAGQIAIYNGINWV